MARIEIRISDTEKLNLDILKQQLGVTTSELFREFLNSYDIGSKKEKLKKLEEEKKNIRKELFKIYSELRENYLPYRIVLEILRDHPDYTKTKKINFQKKDRLEKLDELRVKRDSFKARLKTIEINLEKHKI